MAKSTSVRGKQRSVPLFPIGYKLFINQVESQQWKRYHLVLRPNLLSVYKSSSEEKLQKQINLSDLTAVAYLKDPKDRRQNIFGLFSPAKNFHLQAKDEKDARDWVELIRREARIDEQEEEMTYGSPVAQEKGYQSLTHAMRSSDDHDAWERERLGSSSPEPAELSRPSTTRDGIRIPGPVKPLHHEFDYSGNDHGSYSDFSDTAPARLYGQLSVLPSNPALRVISNAATSVPSTVLSEQQQPEATRNPGDLGMHQTEQDAERVIWHGYLLCLKSKRGVRQWKKLWVVLRPKNLAFYKTEEVLSASQYSLGFCSDSDRNTLPTSSSRSQVLLAPLRSTLFREASHIACRSSRRRRAFASVLQVRRPWLGGWGH